MPPNEPENIKKPEGTSLVFIPKDKAIYKIVSILDQSKALTVNSTSNKAEIQGYNGSPNQKFNIYTQGNKVAFVLVGNQNALCVLEDKPDSRTPIVGDPGKHASSWFEVVTVDKGNYLGKGFFIKTNFDKVFDISESKAVDGKVIWQHPVHNGGNQVWLIE